MRLIAKYSAQLLILLNIFCFSTILQAQVPTQFSPYVPPSDLALEAENIQLQNEVGRRLQANYDQNLKEIRSLIERISELNSILAGINRTKSIEIANNVNAYMRKVGGLDFSQRAVVSSINTTLNNYIASIKYYIQNSSRD